MNRKLMLYIFALVTLIVGMLASQAPASAIDREALQRGLRSSVKLGILDASDEIVGTCSGTILDNQGFILTNFHCVGQTDLYGPDPSFAHGELYHPQGLLLVAVNENPRDLPVPTYVAQFLSGNPDQDVAVVKIVQYINGNQPLPAQLPLIAGVLVDSDQVEIGEEVNVIGFPGLGGATVTFTEGSISGFLDDDADRVIDWFKTSALINAGNSGGTAVNERGEVIGVPSGSRGGGPDRTQDALYLIKPVNHAVPVIERAKQVGTSDTNVGTGPRGGTPPPSGSNIGTITFGTAMGQNGLTGAASAFPSGTGEIHALVPYQNMRDGTPWGYIWVYEGQEAISEPELRWDDGAAGNLDLSVFADGGLPDGDFSLQVYVNNRMVQEGSFTVGSANPIENDKPTSPPPIDEEGIYITGQILDIDTGKPLEGAVIAFLIPGMTVADLDAADDFRSVVMALGVTDASGTFFTDMPLPRGEVFSVVIGREGYQRLAFDDAYETTADDPALTELEPLGLERR